MKETISGILMIRIVMVVLVLFVAFLAISANYARAFRVKNSVIDILEQNQGYTKTAKAMIISYINDVGYSCGGTTDEEIVEYIIGTGYKSIDVDINGSTNTYYYYDVRTCVKWGIPLFDAIGSWSFTGKTDMLPNNPKLSPISAIK